MNYEELIKKIENTELPEMQLSGHKDKLRRVLMNPGHYQQPGFLVFFKRPLIFAGPALVLFVIAGFLIVEPRLAEAKAIKIARGNEDVRRLLEEKNMTLKDVKIKDGKAYVLLNSPEVKSEADGGSSSISLEMKNSEKGKEESKTKNGLEGAVVEINMNQKKVVQIQSIHGEDVAPLDENDKKKAKEIAEATEVLHEMIPPDAEVEKVESNVSGNLRFREGNEEIKVVPERAERKKARVYYRSTGDSEKRWIIEVNLEKKEVEKVEVSPDDND